MDLTRFKVGFSPASLLEGHLTSGHVLRCPLCRCGFVLGLGLGFQGVYAGFSPLWCRCGAGFGLRVLGSYFKVLWVFQAVISTPAELLAQNTVGADHTDAAWPSPCSPPVAHKGLAIQPGHSSPADHLQRGQFGYLSMQRRLNIN